jgi:hypothetical protein
MRKLVIVASSIVIIMGVGIGSASAQNSLMVGKMGIGVGLGNSVFSDTSDSIIDITGKYFIADDMALLAGFGFETHGGDADGSYWGLTLGVRKYLDRGDFVLFIEGKLSYIKEDYKFAGDDIDTDTIDLSAGFGAEYFLHEQFSVEGSVGIGFGIEDDNHTHDDDVYLGTRTIGVKANFYF